MACSCIAIAVNVALNYVLIFGKFGAPEMGVAGAACATLIARCIEVSLILLYVYGKRLPLPAALRGFLAGKETLSGAFLELCPVIANEFMWVWERRYIPCLWPYGR